MGFVVRPYFPRIDHATLQQLQREHRLGVVYEAALQQVVELFFCVFFLELFDIEKITAACLRIEDGHNLAPNSV